MEPFNALLPLGTFTENLNADILGIKKLLSSKACGEMNSGITNLTSLEHTNEFLAKLVNTASGVLPALERIAGVDNNHTTVGPDCLTALTTAFSGQLGSITGGSPATRKLLGLFGLGVAVPSSVTNLATAIPGADNVVASLLLNMTDSVLKMIENITDSTDIVTDLGKLLKKTNDQTLATLMRYVNSSLTQNLFDKVSDLALNTDLQNLNLTSTMNLLNILNNIDKTLILQQLNTLGLAECAAAANDFLTQQSSILNGDSLSSLQDEITAFSSSYNAFLSTAPAALRGGSDDALCTSSLESFLGLINNLTLLSTFMAPGDFVGQVLALREKVDSLFPQDSADDLGSCSWPMKNSIWKIPGNGLISCDESGKTTGSNSTTSDKSGARGNLKNVIASTQKELLTNVEHAIQGVSTSVLSAGGLLDNCALNALTQAANSCGNTTDVVLSDALGFLTSTLGSIKDINENNILPLKNSLNKALRNDPTFSTYGLAEDVQKMATNVTTLLAQLQSVTTLLKTVDLALVGNVASLLPSFYSNLDDFKLVPLSVKELNSLSLFSALSNGSEEVQLDQAGITDMIGEFASTIGGTLNTVQSELQTATDNLGNVFGKLMETLNGVLQKTAADETFYR